MARNVLAAFRAPNDDDTSPNVASPFHPESALPRCGLAGHVKRRDERLVGGLWLDCVDEVRAGREVLGLGRHDQAPPSNSIQATSRLDRGHTGYLLSRRVSR